MLAHTCPTIMFYILLVIFDMPLHVLSRIGFFLTVSSLLSTPGAKSTSASDFTARNKVHILSYCGSLQYRDLHKAQTASYKKIAGWLTQDKYFQLKFGVIHQA